MGRPRPALRLPAPHACRRPAAVLVSQCHSLKRAPRKPMRTCAWTPDKFQHPACALREIHRNTLLASYPSSHANPKVAEHNTLKPQGRRTQHGSPLFQRIVGDLCRHQRPCWAPTQTSATLPDPHADIGDLAGPSPRDRLTSPRNTVITAEVSGVKRSRGMGSNGVGWGRTG